MKQTKTPLRAIREHCLDCSGGSSKCVTWCPRDGVHSTWCSLWLYRFGIRPASALRRYGDRVITPEKIPVAGVNLDNLPSKGLPSKGTLEPAACCRERKPAPISGLSAGATSETSRAPAEHKGPATWALNAPESKSAV